MRPLLLLLTALALGAQAPTVEIHLEPLGKTTELDLDALRTDLGVLLRENGFTQAGPGVQGALKLTLRPESFPVKQGIAAYSAVAYLERPGESKALRGRVVSALRGRAALGLELRQASLDVAASVLVRSLPEGSQMRRVLVQGPPTPERRGDLPFESLKIRVHPLDPPYPRLARRRGVQGHVKARVTLGADGRPQRADLVSGPEELAVAGLCSALDWAFDPVQGPAGPVEARTVMDIPFNLSMGMLYPGLPIEEKPDRDPSRHNKDEGR